MIDENHILIDSGGNPPELYAIEDRKQQQNLAAIRPSGRAWNACEPLWPRSAAHLVVSEPQRSLPRRTDLLERLRVHRQVASFTMILRVQNQPPEWGRGLGRLVHRLGHLQGG